MTRWAAMAALLLGGCETSSPTCAGEVQGTLVFNFQARPPPTSTCLYLTLPPGGDPASLPRARFTAAVAWRSTPADGAALCIQAPLAQDRLGTHTGDHLVFPGLAASTAAVHVGICPCRVDFVESLDGSLVRDPDGVVTGFDGTLSLVLTRTPADESPAGTCYATHDAAVASGATEKDDCPPASGGCLASYVWPP